MPLLSHSSDDDKDNVGDPEPGTSSYQQGNPRHPDLAIPGSLPNEQQPREATEGNNSRNLNKKTSRIHAFQLTSPLHNRGPGTKNVVEGDVHTHPEQTKHRTPSLQSLLQSTGGEDRDGKAPIKGGSLSGDGTPGRRVSVRTNRSVRTSITTGAFVNGSPLAGPNAVPDVDESIYWRGSNAERLLNKKEKEKIFKDEKKEAKQLSKLLKLEATTEKTALNSALNVLASLQEQHKAAIKRGAKAECAHARALSKVQKAESKYHEARARTTEEHARAEARVSEERAKLEGKQEEVKAQEERVESERQIIKELEDRVTECARDLEKLRIIKATDERERRAKIAELCGGTPVL
ncbi:hypothetical protein V8B97DRAFT_1957955, partial [Scleroderma yunnanense]